MKRFVFFVSLAAAPCCSTMFASGGFPFLHTRPKPVLLYDQPSTAQPARSHATYRAAAYQKSNEQQATSARAPYDRAARSSLSDLFTRSWHFGETSKNKSGPARK